jgi:hypothetical protein
VRVITVEHHDDLLEGVYCVREEATPTCSFPFIGKSKLQEYLQGQCDISGVELSATVVTRVLIQLWHDWCKKHSLEDIDKARAIVYQCSQLEHNRYQKSTETEEFIND